MSRHQPAFRFFLSIFLIGLYSNCKAQETFPNAKLTGTGLSRINLSYKTWADSFMLRFDELYGKDTVHIKALYGNAKAAIVLADSMYDYLQSIKEILARNAGGWRDESKNAVEEDQDLVFPETYFIIQDSGKNGIELRNRLEDYGMRMRSLAIDKKGKAVSLKFTIDTQKEREDEDGNVKRWHEYYFGEVPVIAAITEITKFQNDVRNAESEVLNLLYKEAKR